MKIPGFVESEGQYIRLSQISSISEIKKLKKEYLFEIAKVDGSTIMYMDKDIQKTENVKNIILEALKLWEERHGRGSK